MTKQSWKPVPEKVPVTARHDGMGGGEPVPEKVHVTARHDSAGGGEPVPEKAQVTARHDSAGGEEPEMQNGQPSPSSTRVTPTCLAFLPGYWTSKQDSLFGSFYKC